MTKPKAIFSVLLVLSLLLVGGITFFADTELAAAQSEKAYLVRTFFDKHGKQIDQLVFPGKPPKVKAKAVDVPEPNVEMGINGLSDVPAFDWSYGCSATSAAMLAGYYDRESYTNMYAGVTNGGICPLDNTIWGYGECPLSATHQGIDGLASRGHVDDYWVAYGHFGDDPFIVNGWPEHSYEDCTGDFMGTNQDNWNNSDSSTTFFFYSDGSPLYDFTDYEWFGLRDGCHGIKLFVESRGYTVTTNFNQYIMGQGSNPSKGVTFSDFMSEIDAGRPVLIHVTGHTMIGYGYDTATNKIYIHDTWDHNEHEMTWGGAYSGLQHEGVTVIRLSSTTQSPIVTTNDATDITTNSARLNGYLDDLGSASAVDVSFVWGETSGGPYPNETSPPDTMNDFGAFYFDLDGLTADTTYYFKAKAVGDGTTLGDERNFTTEAITTPPAVTTNDASPITTNSARLNGYLDDLGSASAVDVSFLWGETSGGPYPNETSPPDTMGDFGAFYFDLDSLTSDTTYYFKAKAVGDGTTLGDERNFTTEVGEPTIGSLAYQDISISGSINGDYNDTHSSDNVTESITEARSKGNSKMSYLEHKWIFDVVPGSRVTFYLEAYQSENTEGDNFIFAYSTDDTSYTDMVTVTKTADDNSYQTYELPISLSGTVYIRVVDTDQTRGNTQLDTIYIDHMYIESYIIDPEVLNLANQDISVSGTVSGDYHDTHSSDDVVQSIEEVQSKGKSNKTYLEHKWTIYVHGGNQVTFYLEAYQSENTEGDNFIFAYSTDDTSYTDMVTVTKTADDNSYQTYELPISLSGTVYIRVVDTDQTRGNTQLDTIYIDHMYIESVQ